MNDTARIVLRWVTSLITEPLSIRCYNAVAFVNFAVSPAIRKFRGIGSKFRIADHSRHPQTA